MTALSDMVDGIFDDENMTVSAVYYRVSDNSIFDVRAVYRVNNDTSSFLGTGSYQEGTYVKIRQADIAVPVEGDLISIGVSSSDVAVTEPNFWTTSDTVRRVRGAKRDKSTGLIWQLNVDEIV